jgi:electron transfer flavoprotein alpha subunit
MSSTWVIGESRDAAVKKVTYELVSAARAAAPQWPVTVVLIGTGLHQAAADVAARDVEKVLLLDGEALQSFSPDGWALALADAVRAASPELVLGPATARGRELLARLAADLDVGVASDVVQLGVADGTLQAVRPIYAGRALASVRVSGQPLVATVRPNIYPPAGDVGKGAPVESLPVAAASGAARATGFSAAASSRPDVAEADIIVSGGRGMGAPEHFHLVEELADQLGAAVGASRAAVDAGWRPHSEQVGQTGKTVSPSLYVACGISGAMQHLAGMKTAKVIVAINKDPEAPIFSVADYGIVADLFEALPALTRAVREFRGQ